MEQVKVSDLASEFAIRNSIVIVELKKIGVWVPSPDTQVDQDIANRIRRRLQLLAEEQEESAEAKDKKPAQAKARKSIRQLGRPRRTPRAKPVEEPPADSPLAGSLKPRKGRSTYRRVERHPEAPERLEVTLHPEARVEPAPPPGEVVAPEPEAAAVAAPEPTAPETPVQAPVEAKAPQTPKEAEAPVQKPAPSAPPAKPKRTRVVSRPAPTVQRVPDRSLYRRQTGRTQAGPVPRAHPQQAARPSAQKAAKKKEPIAPQDLTLSETLTVKEFSEKIGVKAKDVLKELIGMGVMATINQTLGRDVMEKLCTVFKVTPTFVSFEEAVMEEEQGEDKPGDLAPRPPVVTVMGHVDHGKTSLLDAIRQTSVAAGEAGGITQHIGAYHVDVNDQRIVFLDTPGHEAFTLMRARGAKATDVVVLVVAADDGVMPQTREAIDHARAAGVPILVAINKIDKPDAQPDRVKQQLSEFGLTPEAWGGDTVTVDVSATAKTNLDLLLEMILLVSEVLELKANPKRAASGVILEATLDKGRGAVATVLVQNGTLKVGDHFIAGSIIGKVRAMFDDLGEQTRETGPGSAVEILGFQGLPEAGDTFQVVADAAKARQVVEYRIGKEKGPEQAHGRLTLDELYSKMKAGEIKELPVVVKADMQGSAEVVTELLSKLSTDEVKVRVIHSSVGAVTESNVLLASASNAIVIGFNVRPEKSAQDVAEREGVDIRLYTVIYNIKDEIEQALTGMLEPTFQERHQGRAEVREIFKVPRHGMVAGCYVQDGTIPRNAEVRLLRDNVVVHEGKIGSLRRFKDDVASVRQGFECGISIAGYQDLKPGDIIEAFTREQVARTLN